MKRESNFQEIRTSRLFFLFTDNHVIVADAEDAVQIFIHNLETVTTKNDQTFQKSKRRTVAFKGRDPVRSKIVINNNNIEQINSFNYPGCSVAYQA
jgi:hypothetical protein